MTDSNCCERCCFEGNREYNLSLVYNDEIVARIKKPYRVSRFCCYSNSVKIESPEDNPIGNIKQMFTFFGHPRYAIYDCQQEPKKPSFYLESVSCKLCCTPLLCTCVCGNKEFRIVSSETRDEVGIITRQWSSLAASSSSAEFNSSAAEASSNNNNINNEESIVDQPFANGNGSAGQLNDNSANSGPDQLFGVTFLENSNLEARHKVLLLSACFMMDFFYFENDRRRRKLASC